MTAPVARWQAGRRPLGARLARGLLTVGIAATVLPLSSGAAPAAVRPAEGEPPERCAGAQREAPPEAADTVEALTPVVMIHGITGSSDQWRRKIEAGVNPYVRGNGRTLVEQVDRIPGAVAYTFDYHPHSLRWIDRPEISERFAGAIDCLYDAFGKPVIVVGHSMGGLVARWVANTSTDAGEPRADRIGLAITLGTPYQGSDLLRLARAAIDGGAALSAVARDPRLPLVRAWIQACGRTATRRVDDCSVPLVNAAYSEAGDALTAGSSQLRVLDRWPDSVDVHALAGSVQLGVRGDGLFVSSRDVAGDEATEQWGDILVSTASATADGDEQRIFTCRHTVALERTWAPGEGLVNRVSPFDDIAFVERNGQLDQPLTAPWESPCYHDNLTSTVEVTNEVIGLIHDRVGGAAVTAAGAAGGRGVGTPTATQGPATMVVVDTSGSMGEDDGHGVIKIDGAKDSLLGYLAGVAPDTTVGLRTYPGGGSGCGAGTLEFEPAKRNPAEMSAFVRGLSADGDTPTAEALRAAADDLRAAGIAKATLVLLSDGESTCDDPCAAAAEMRQSGLDVEIIAVAFQLSAEGAEELQCIADETGGAYIDAADTEDLASVIGSLTAPRLEVSLDHPATVVADVGVTGSVEIEATVTNASEVEARAVTAKLRIDDGASPGLVAPQRPLGNLAPGAATSTTWRFRPAVSAAGSTFRFTVLATSADSVDVEASGEIAITDGTTRGSAGPLLHDADRVAILGDSFSAGEGTSEYIAGTDVRDRNMCHRSRQTYLVEALAIPDELILACSGATAQHIQTTNWGNHEPPQVTRLGEQQEAGGPVDAVVMTIGGNNASFSTFIKACVWPGRPSCDELVDGVPASDWVDDRLGFDNFARHVISAYVAIDAELNAPRWVEERGGVAPIVVLAYPRIIPVGRRSCPGVPTLSAQELSFANEFVTRLNAEVEAAVGTARDMGFPVAFVPETEGVMQPNHTVCDGDGAYARPPRDVLGEAGTKELFHPNVSGYLALTRGIMSWSNTEAADALVSVGADEPRRVPAGLAVDVVATDTDRPPVTVGLAEDEMATARRGEPVELRVDGFAPDGPVEIRVESDPLVLGEASADADGAVTAVVGLPTDIAAGRHEVVVTGAAPNGTPRNVRLPVDVGRSRSWGWLWPVGAALVSVVLLAAGGALLRRQSATAW